MPNVMVSCLFKTGNHNTRSLGSELLRAGTEKQLSLSTCITLGRLLNSVGSHFLHL